MGVSNLLYHAQEQLYGFLRNFPNRFLGGVMRFLILPRGRAYSAPDDRLGRKVADLVMSPTEARERLCQYMYWTLEPTNPFGLLQEALVLAQTAEPLEKRSASKASKRGALPLSTSRIRSNRHSPLASFRTPKPAPCANTIAR